MPLDLCVCRSLRNLPKCHYTISVCHSLWKWDHAAVGPDIVETAPCCGGTRYCVISPNATRPLAYVAHCGNGTMLRWAPVLWKRHHAAVGPGIVETTPCCGISKALVLLPLNY
ncbi:hypothetical protein TNCV_1068331 [Trichonephila clavipes]|nr:hypothetical protein TNCV_1068331 [Trichonephila clavipes]